jgi:hypothetical protein
VSLSAEESPKHRRLSIECSLICVDVCEQWELRRLLLATSPGSIVPSERLGFESIETPRPLVGVDCHPTSTSELSTGSSETSSSPVAPNAACR